MIIVSSEDITRQTQVVEEVYKSESSAPLLFDNFYRKIKKSSPSDFTPREIKIPKTVHEMLKGDFEPSRVIKVDEELSIDGIRVWDEDSTKGVKVRGLGYLNGDSRYPSSLVLNDTNIHGILAGATGHGKSVTLNSMIFGIALDYAPWEVKLSLLDAKVVEFKRYALQHRLPHLISVAATTDSDYMLSVLENLITQMRQVNQIFSVAGVQNIIDFREKTGLALPRNVIVFDEFQSAYKDAGKRKTLMDQYLDSFARLGRSTGFHLVLSSQEPGELSNATLANINVRIALGCTAPVSEKILGNNEATMNFNIKGRLILNTNPTNNDKLDNLHYRVPLQTSSLFSKQNEELAKLGEKVNFSYDCAFYDEASFLDETDYDKFIASRKNRNNVIYLGEPSFVNKTDDGDPTLRINLTGGDIENIIVNCSAPKDIQRYLKMLAINIKNQTSDIVNNVFTSDRKLAIDSGLSEITNEIFDLRQHDDERFSVYLYAMYRRKLALEADDLVFSSMINEDVPEDIKELFYEAIEKGSELDTELNMVRFRALGSLLTSNAYLSAFNIQPGDLEKKLKVMRECLTFYHFMEFSNQKMTKDNIPLIINWIVGIEKILGYGRDYRAAAVSNLKKAMQDSLYAKTLFIISSTDMGELRDLASAFRFCIMDGLNHSLANRIGCPEYPETVAGTLGVFFDKYGDHKYPVKFKKMAFEGEILA